MCISIKAIVLGNGWFDDKQNYKWETENWIKREHITSTGDQQPKNISLKAKKSQ